MGVADADDDEELAPEPPPVLCMECKRNKATIERGKARWCAACLGWIERRKEIVEVFDGKRKRRKKDA